MELKLQNLVRPSPWQCYANFRGLRSGVITRRRFHITLGCKGGEECLVPSRFICCKTHANSWQLVNPWRFFIFFSPYI